jgi:3-phytase
MPRHRIQFIAAVACAAVAGGTAMGQTFAVTAARETDPVPTRGDAADDIAIWVHPADPTRSLIIGTDKRAGLAVYDLDGRERQWIPDGELNNVDVRYGFPLGNRRIDIAAAGNRTEDTIEIYAIDASTGLLTNICRHAIRVGIGDAYGLAMHHDRVTDSFYVFVCDKDGRVEQWRLFDAGDHRIDAGIVRRFEVGSRAEGMVVDDRLGRLYIAEEQVGVWRYGAAPEAGVDRVLVDTAGGGGCLTAEVEGLALYALEGGAGCLIVSSQGADEFAVYDRQTNAYIASFRIDDGPDVDRVTGTDGLDATSMPLGSGFEQGLLIAQDDVNPRGNQNFKLVPWDAIVHACPIPIATGKPEPVRQISRERYLREQLAELMRAERARYRRDRAGSVLD